MNGVCLMTSNGRTFRVPERAKNQWKDLSLFVSWYIMT
jgi:hypothetical protein